MGWGVAAVIAVGLGLVLPVAGQATAEETSGGQAIKVAAAPAGEAIEAAAQTAEKPEDATKVATLDGVAAAARTSSVPVPVTRPAVPEAFKRQRPPAPSLVARIDLSGQRMHVTANGKPVGSWKISSGRSGFETPPGRFRPTWIARRHYSRKYDMAPMPYSVFFNGGIATHGTTALSRLGRPASHGCIRLTKSNARTFYNLVRRHGKAQTKIIVTGRAQQAPAVARRKTRRTARTQRRATARQRNAFGAPRRQARGNAYGGQRLSLGTYERRYQERVRRYQSQRRQLWPGDRY